MNIMCEFFIKLHPLWIGLILFGIWAYKKESPKRANVISHLDYITCVGIKHRYPSFHAVKLLMGLCPLGECFFAYYDCRWAVAVFDEVCFPQKWVQFLVLAEFKEHHYFLIRDVALPIDEVLLYYLRR